MQKNWPRQKMCLELMQKRIKKFAPGLFPLVTGRALWPRRENPYYITFEGPQIPDVLTT